MLGYSSQLLNPVRIRIIIIYYKTLVHFILFVYNPFCNFEVSCEEVFVNTLKNENITLLKIPFNSFKLSKFYKKVKYGPSILIINNGKLVKYLDASDDNDYGIYQDEEKFKEWLSLYIYLSKKD